MKKIICNTIFLFCLFCLLLTSEGCYKEIIVTKIEGDRFQKNLALPPFEKILLDMPAEVRLSQGNEQKITVNAQERIFDLLNQNVLNNTWRIEIESGSYSFEKVYIDITLPTITEIYNDASGDVLTLGEFKRIEHLKLAVDGSGDIHFAGNPKHLETLIDASGDIHIEGTATTMNTTIDGSGSLAAFDFQVDEADILVKASGDGEVYVNKKLEVTIKGSGDVFYKGSPNISSQIESTGSLINAN